MTGGRGVAAPVRVAMVGLGWAATSIWLPRLREHPGFVVTAVVDPDQAARESAAQDRSGTLLLPDVGGLTPDMVDLAVVAVPNHLHAPIACTLLANGIRVFLEKPVCLNSEEASRLAAAERAGGAVLFAGSAARHRADVRLLRDLAEKAGRVRHVELEWVRARGVPDAGGWFTRRELAGGGALVDLGWHLLDTLAALLGSPRFDQVAGTVSSDFVNHGSARAAWRRDESAGPEEAVGGGGDVEDTARCFLVTRSGVSVSLRASWASHRARDATRIRVDGSAGTLELNCTFGFSPNREGGPALTYTQDGITTTVPVPPEPIGAEYARQLDELHGLLATAEESQGRAVEETRRTIDVIERVYESARLARTPSGAARGPGRREPSTAALRGQA
ncbi:MULTISPECIES: Gfo/Idh/MocA family protein [Streptomyces]|uniref:Gfo/Idh/MocA family protein n=1 Tax=Streptomyces TaxID=1883 RepID=UPI001653ADA4|nr:MULTISPECIES: Gfo/Idh/MocA family oxidoreductase [Streptomyces]